MALAHLDVCQARSDALDPILVAGEEDVLGQLAWSEADVVLPFAIRKRDAGIRVRQGLSSMHMLSVGAQLRGG